MNPGSSANNRNRQQQWPMKNCLGYASGRKTHSGSLFWVRSYDRNICIVIEGEDIMVIMTLLS